MLPQISVEQATSRHWDVVIAGSSFAAMFFLRGLRRDLSVLVVEKGPVQSHAAQIAGGTKGMIHGAEDFAQKNNSKNPKSWVAHSVFGGNSNAWWGRAPRFHPSDFEMAARYRVAEDWPLTYDDLAPYYQRVEEIMQISGGGSDHILPRQAPFPYPPHLPTRSDKVLRAHSPNWFAQPTARANGGDRAPCCANGVCTRCPVDAKFTILNGIDAFAHPGVALLPSTELRRLRVEAGSVTGAELRTDLGVDHEVTADLVALGTNAIFNAAILLRSGIKHPKLGKGLHEQSSIFATVDGDALGYYGGTSITGHGYDLYDGAHRSDHSGILIEVYNTPSALRSEPGKWQQRALLKLIAEDLPQDRNQVVLSRDGAEAPELIWHGHSDYLRDGLTFAKSTLPEILPPGLTVKGYSDLATTEAHIMGTHRMGNDPRLHVLDANMAVRGVSGVLALGSGAFTTSAPANPSLTISALSLRAAEALA